MRPATASSRLLTTLYARDGNQAKGFGENPNQMIFVFKDINNWIKGTEHINGLELFLKDRGHLIEKLGDAEAGRNEERISNSS